MRLTVNIIYFLIPIIFILGCYFMSSFKKLKAIQNKRLHDLSSELLSEKKIKKILKNTSEQMDKLSNSMGSKFLKIRVDIFNIDFTLKEIFL